MSRIRLQITCASPEWILEKLTEAGVSVYEIEPIDLLNYRLKIEKTDMDKTKLIFKKYEVTYKILRVYGLYYLILKVWKRPVLTVGILLFTVLNLYLPSRIFFVAVEGNVTIPTKYILEKAERSGVRFGISRKEIRNEKIKNRLLSEIPELQWIGVNTYGCFAVISVEEKTVNKPQENVPYNTNIVASRDAVISEMSVLRGTALCRPGDAVKQGQILISGYSDVGLCIRLTGADGEIRGYTQRSLELKTPTEYVLKGKQSKINRRYSIFFGKKLINFDKCSGISGAICDRMYEEYYLVLPGGFQLPVGFVVETTVYYETALASQTDPGGFDWMDDAAEHYLSNQMIAGQILRKDTQLSIDADACRFYGVYRCHEMIAQIRYEEMLQQYEQRN